MLAKTMHLFDQILNSLTVLLHAKVRAQFKLKVNNLNNCANNYGIYHCTFNCHPAIFVYVRQLSTVYLSCPVLPIMILERASININIVWRVFHKYTHRFERKSRAMHNLPWCALFEFVSQIEWFANCYCKVLFLCNL